jgi:hypothetical protein
MLRLHFQNLYGHLRILPDIPIPPPDNDIELDLRQQLLETPDTLDLPQTSSDYPTLQSGIEALIKVGQETILYFIYSMVIFYEYEALGECKC